MQFEKTQIGPALIVKPLEKRVDTHATAGFKETMVGLIGAGQRTLVLDLSQVEFIDSSGLGTIVSLLKVLGQSGTLLLCGLQPTVLTLFKLTRMDKVFGIFPDAASAADSLVA